MLIPRLGRATDLTRFYAAKENMEVAAVALSEHAAKETGLCLSMGPLYLGISCE